MSVVKDTHSLNGSKAEEAKFTLDKVESRKLNAEIVLKDGGYISTVVWNDSVSDAIEKLATEKNVALVSLCSGQSAPVLKWIDLNESFR